MTTQVLPALRSMSNDGEDAAAVAVAVEVVAVVVARIGRKISVGQGSCDECTIEGSCSMRTLGQVGHHPTTLFLLVTGSRLRLAQSRPAAPRGARASQADPNQPDQPAGRQPKFSRRPGKWKSCGSSQERRTASRIQL